MNKILITVIIILKVSAKLAIATTSYDDRRVPNNLGDSPDRRGINLSIKFDERASVKWLGEIGLSYQLQGTTNLTSQNWVDIGTPLTGRNDVFDMDVSEYPQTYFKVEMTRFDPSQPGSYLSSIATYGSTGESGRYAAENLTDGYAIARRVDSSAFLSTATDCPINGIVFIPEDAPHRDSRFPLAIIVHGNHDPEIPSENGYLYLCEHLASHGIIAATIDENFLNMQNNETVARAIVLLEHIKQFKVWNETPGHPLENKIDLKRIMLIGHSRGGEAVEHASFYNRLGPTERDPITNVTFDGGGPYHLGPYNFDLKALVAMAPSEGRYSHGGTPVRRSIADDYLIIQGSKDGDLSDFQGYRTYERAHPSALGNHQESADASKALVWIHGANHSQFNTLWDGEYFGRPTITPEQQTRVAKYYITSFAYSKLYDYEHGLSPFRDNRIGSAFLPGIRVVTQYQDAFRRFISHYDDDNIMSTPSYPNEGAISWDLRLSETNFLNDVLQFYRADDVKNVAAHMQWSSTGSHYTIHLDKPIDTSIYDVLSFRMAQDFAPNNEINIKIEVSDASKSVEFDLSNYATIWHPDPTECFLNEGKREVMQTVRIPLADVMAAGVNPNTITTIKLKFAALENTIGSVYFDDLQYSK